MVMAVETKRCTVEEFDQFVGLPENADRLFEYIEGERVEGPSKTYFLKNNHELSIVLVAAP